ncbi:MAG: Type secretion system protein precursor, partial [Planctomycetota bacterium]
LMAVAIEVIGQLDRPREGDAPVEIRVYPLSEATADTVAKAIELAVSARAQSRLGRIKPTITPEMTSNSIVVAADPAQLDEIEKTVRDMDVRGPRDAARVRTVFLKQARAAQMAPLIEQLLASESGQPGVRGGRAARAAAAAGTATEPPLRVIADSRLNAVVISATPTALDAAEEMLRQLDVAPGTESDRTVQVITLRNGDATEVAKSLADIFETDEGTEIPPVIRVNVASNSLLVRANAKQHAMLSTIVTRLDSAALASSRALRSVPLDPSKGDAEEVARLLRRLMQQANGDVEVITVDELLKRYDTPRTDDKPGGNGGGAAPPAGSQGRLDAVDPMPTRMGPGWPPSLPARLAFVQLAFAQVPAVADNSVPPTASAAQGATDAAAGAKDEDRSSDGVTVAVDKDSNSLLLLGSPREIERAMKLIEQASRSLPGESSRIRSIKLPPSADPARIASVVTGAVARITPPGGQAGDLAKRVAIVADEESRALIVVASDRDFEAVGQLVAALARGQASQQLVVKSFVLRNTGAERVAEALRAILSQGGGVKLRSLAVTLAGDIAGGGSTVAFDPTTVRVFAEKGANAVTIVGDPQAVEFVDRFVAFTDRAERSVTPELRLVPIRHAKASEVVKSLQTAMLARARSLTAQGIVASVPEFSADDRTNMVVIAGGADMGTEIERLLGVLDAPSPIAGAVLETVVISSGRPSDVLATIEKVVFDANPSLRDHARIVADDSAGVLLIRADETARGEIARVVSEVDRGAARQFPIRQVKLERADAQRVATALQKLFDDRASMSAGRGRQRSVSIVADVRSSSIFVTAGEADYAEIEELVKGFDAPGAAKSLDFKVFTLKFARAGETAAALEQLLSAMGVG